MAATVHTDFLATLVTAEGGATWKGNEDAPFYGYLVSVSEYEYTCSVEDFGPSVLDAYEAVTPLPEDAYYGAWVDGETVYLDVSLHVNTLDEALMIADLENQKSVFNAMDNVVINTRELVTS